MNRIVCNLEVAVTGRMLKTAKVRNEWYDFVEDAAAFVPGLRESGIKAHLFTFLQEPHEREPKYSFHRETDSISIMPISTYEHWLKKQINDKTRNMVRKAGKSGVEIRPTAVDAPFIEGVVGIYNESPVRQGRRFWHYGMDFNGARSHLETFKDRSHYVGAYHGEELIGFFKLTRNKQSASVMQIISKMAHRNRAPNNALLAKAVEMCAEMGIPFLQYGIWSRGGLGEYKTKHGFVRFDIPRYYVPLNAAGRLALQFRLYRKPARLVPPALLDRLSAWRAAWYAHRYERRQLPTGQ